MNETAVPLPPSELIERIGDDPGDTADRYLSIGQQHRKVVEAHLRSDWTWSNKTYVDWGAGAGRLIRHFAPEATTNRIIAADIDEPSIKWICEHLAPIEGLLVGPEPRIDLDDSSVDLITGFSVMTHIADDWAAWLLEARRILKPGGLALLSFCGEAMVPVLVNRPVAIDDIGMLVVKYGTPWAFGGPTVLHSPWWIRTHWGRAFEILRIDHEALRGLEQRQDLAVMRRPTTAAPSIAALEHLDQSEPRETAALMSQLAQARAELSDLRANFERVRYEAHANELVAEDRALQLVYIRGSRSWRLTRPVRNLLRWLRRSGENTLE